MLVTKAHDTAKWSASGPTAVVEGRRGPRLGADQLLRRLSSENGPVGPCNLRVIGPAPRVAPRHFRPFVSRVAPALLNRTVRGSRRAGKCGVRHRRGGRRRVPHDGRQVHAAATVSVAVSAQPCRLTMALIQIGAKGEVQPLETG
jgi:hypothetical protein